MTTEGFGVTEPIKVAVVGAGWAGDLHVAAFRAAGAHVVALYSRTGSRADALARRHGVPRVCGSFEELINEVDADLVSIASPPPAHHEQTLAAVKAGRHVLCDKPVAMTATQAQEMLRAAQAAGVRHATGFIWRFDPAIARMRALIHAGAIGRVVEVHTTCALAMPLMPMNWLYLAEEGGGALMQHGCHVIDRVRYLLDAEIVRLVGRLHYDLRDAAAAGQFHHTQHVFEWAMRHRGRVPDTLPRHPVTADVGYEFMGELSTGVRVRFWESTHLCGPVEDQVVVVGERGALEWSSGRLLRHLPGRAAARVPTGVSSGSGGRAPHEVGALRWADLAGRVVAAINGHPCDHPTLVDGWWLARVVEALHRSHHSGIWELV